MEAPAAACCIASNLTQKHFLSKHIRITPAYGKLWFLSQSRQSHKITFLSVNDLEFTWIYQNTIVLEASSPILSLFSLIVYNLSAWWSSWWSIAEVFSLSSGGVEVLHHQGGLRALLEEEWDADEAVVEDFSQTHKAAKACSKATHKQPTHACM